MKKHIVCLWVSFGLLITGCSGVDLAAALNPTVTTSGAASEILKLDRIDASESTVITESMLAPAQLQPMQESTEIALANCGVGSEAGVSWEDVNMWWRGPTHCSNFITLDPIPDLERSEVFDGIEKLESLTLDLAVEPLIRLHYENGQAPDSTHQDFLGTIYVWGFGTTMLFTHPLYDPIWAVTSSLPTSTLEPWYSYLSSQSDDTTHTYQKDFPVRAESTFHTLEGKTVDDLRVMLMYNGETQVRVAGWAIIGKNSLTEGWLGPDTLGADPAIQSISFELSAGDLTLIADTLAP